MRVKLVKLYPRRVVLLRMMSEIVSFEILAGIVSGNKDEDDLLLPNTKVSAFQSGGIPAQTSFIDVKTVYLQKFL